VLLFHHALLNKKFDFSDWLVSSLTVFSGWV